MGLLRGRGALAFDADALESRLVWIFGSPRSGSTWLMQLLVHPLEPAPDAPLGMRRREIPAAAVHAAAINEPYIAQHLCPLLLESASPDDELATVTLNSFRHGDPSYFFSDRYAHAWRPELRRLLLTRLHAQAERARAEFSVRDPLVVIKEPNGSLGADFVMSLLPRARLMFLLRDGRDVVDSMLDARAPGGWLARAGEKPPDAAERLRLIRHESRLWLARTEAVQRAYEAHPHALRHLVRYEDARRDPAGVLAGLDAWLKLRRSDQERQSALSWNDFDSYPAEAKGRGMPLRAAHPGLWRQNLSAAEQQEMGAILGAKLTELGYAT